MVAAAPPDRERLSNDQLNTGVTAALIGGFALSNLQSGGLADASDTSALGTLGVVVYVLSCLSVHACTCSALTSALLYRVINQLEDDGVAIWAGRHRILLTLPLMKFGMGCVSYLSSVLLLSFRDLDGLPVPRIMALVIGTASMSTVMMTVVAIARDSPQSSAHARVTPFSDGKVNGQ